MAVAFSLRTQKKQKTVFLFPILQIQTFTSKSTKPETNANRNPLKILCQPIMKRCLESSEYASLLQGCINNRSLLEGKLVHAHIIQAGFEFQNMAISNKILSMYAKCGCMENAGNAFDKMPQRDVASWTVIIAGYARQGHADAAMKLFYEMQQAGIQPNQFTFAGVLPACVDVAAVKDVHDEIIRCGFESDVFVGTVLVNRYAKVGNVKDARHVFDRMSERDVVSWNTMVACYVQNGYSDEALQFFHEMRRMGIDIDHFSFASVVSACANYGVLREVHGEIIKCGFEGNVIVANALVDMYGKCGNMEDAHNVFDKMPQRNAISWTAMIAGYMQNGHANEALQLFWEMPEQNVVSWNAVIAGYSQHGYLDEALEMFQRMPDRDIISWNTIIAGYVQNGYVEEALKLFEAAPERDVVTWNVMIAGYTQNGHIDEAMKLFQKMPRQDVISWNTMIAGYAQIGQIGEALKLFQKMPKRDTVSWNLMIAAYAQYGCIHEIMKLFKEMPERNLISWNTMIAVNIENRNLEEAHKIFQEMPERNSVSWNTMLSGYSQNGYVNKALKLFEEMPERDVVSWTEMIAGYAHNGYSDEGLKLFREMQFSGVKPKLETFAIVIPICANLAVLEKGKEVHEVIIRSGFKSDVFVGSALVDMYAKCGSIENARNMFDKMQQRDVVSWSAMILGYAMHGCSQEALQLFENMQQFGTKPDHVTFIGVLSACCHAGLVDKGWECFDSMSSYGIAPTMEHYGCMVDLLGRAGHLDEAKDLINKMPIKPDATVWGCLLGACRIHNNIELGELVAECLFELDPDNAAHYVLLSNIYAASRRWDSLEKVRKIMKDKMIQKKPGCSWIEVNGQVHSFISGNRSPPEEEKIYGKLDTLSRQMRSSGYVPDMISAE